MDSQRLVAREQLLSGATVQRGVVSAEVPRLGLGTGRGFCGGESER